jgi:hypothetical protein
MQLYIHFCLHNFLTAQKPSQFPSNKPAKKKKTPLGSSPQPWRSPSHRQACNGLPLGISLPLAAAAVSAATLYKSLGWCKWTESKLATVVTAVFALLGLLGLANTFAHKSENLPLGLQIKSSEANQGVHVLTLLCSNTSSKKLRFYSCHGGNLKFLIPSGMATHICQASLLHWNGSHRARLSLGSQLRLLSKSFLCL